jgi:nitrate/nitrite transporter NarK
MGALLSLWDASQTLTWIPGINPFSGPAIVAFVLAVVNLLFVVKRFPETLSGKHDPTHARRPLNPLALLKPSEFPGVNRTNLLYFIYIAAFAGMEFTLTFLAKDRFGYTAAQNGYLFLFIGIVIALVQGGVVRRLAPKYGEIRLVTVGLAMIIPGLVMVAVCQPPGQVMLYAGLFLLAAGSSLATPSLTALVSLYTPTDRQGESLGIFRSLGSLGRAFAPILASLVYWKCGSAWPYFGSAILLLLPIWLAWQLPKPRIAEISTTLSMPAGWCTNRAKKWLFLPHDDCRAPRWPDVLVGSDRQDTRRSRYRLRHHSRGSSVLSRAR